MVFLGVLAMVPAVAVERLAAPHHAGSSGLPFVPQQAHASLSSSADGANLGPITIDYPAEGSIFPPEITAPNFLWRDAAGSATAWLIDVTFSDGSAAIQAKSSGEPPRIGEIDERCVAPTNEVPKLTPEQAAAHTWTPDATTWEAIKNRSKGHPATVTITGVRGSNAEEAVSRGRVAIKTSKDPVGAPIFYRDVPQIPSEPIKGVVTPLPHYALPLVAWRLRYVGEDHSRLLLTGMHSCANCHSFSVDGKTFGMILDGPMGDKGLYAIASIKPQMSIRKEDVISWEASRYKPLSPMRIGFMAQVSPDGRYVVSMVNGAEKYDRAGYYMYFTANYKDYRFNQVFYPTRGTLAWYSRATGRIQPLPGADDPRYVQTDAVWSPDGKYLVFARAEAKDPYPPAWKLPAKANDPEETPIQYDLFRIPFNNGRGGRPEPIAGASQNGMSNSFPKVSPDGRWIIFVEARNGQLLRPDSQLFIVPAQGGEARRLRCNMSLMNSWHSFSPSGRWLVFSSKSRWPYTQMFLTHLDEQGNDSPPILIDNATAANRAVNLPEFMNVPPGGLLKIDVPAAEIYRLTDSGWDWAKKGQLDAAMAEWMKALELDPRDANLHNYIGAALMQEGKFDEAILHLQKALESNPDADEAYGNMGLALMQEGKLAEATAHLQKALEINPGNARAHFNLGYALYAAGKIPQAVAEWRFGLRIQPDALPVLNQTAWVLATCSDASVRNGAEAVTLAEHAAQISGGQDPAILDALAAAYAEAGRFDDAVQTAKRGLSLATEQSQQDLAQALSSALSLYEAKTPLRESPSAPATSAPTH
jgi:tetratricopeptide (TPR) repeat protein